MKIKKATQNKGKPYDPAQGIPRTSSFCYAANDMNLTSTTNHAYNSGSPFSQIGRKREQREILESSNTFQNSHQKPHRNEEAESAVVAKDRGLEKL